MTDLEERGMRDVDEILRDAGAQWRAAQPAPPVPVLPVAHRRARRRPWLVPVAVAAAVLLVAVGIVAVVYQPSSRPTVPATVASAQAASAEVVTSLIVRDGDTVRAVGLVVAHPGEPVEFCPLPAATRSTGPDSTGPDSTGPDSTGPDSTGPEPTGMSCAGFGTAVTGADLADLTGRSVDRAGAITGQAALSGVYRTGVVQVRTQAPAPVPSQAPVRVPASCPAPSGGFPQGTEFTAIGAYVRAQPDRFGGIETAYAPGLARAANDPSGEVPVALVGLATGDVAAAQRELRDRFGAGICVVPVTATFTQLLAAADTVGRLVHDQNNGIYGYGQGFGKVSINVSVLTEARFNALRQVGLDWVSLAVWLEPVR
jgi:hypothetical protein